MKKKNIFLLFVLLILPFCVNASTYKQGVSSTNSYYKKFDTYDRYLLIREDGLPYGYNGNKVIDKSGFVTGGFVSNPEYIITQRGKGTLYSWLNTGTIYWSSTDVNGQRIVISEKKNDTRDENSNLKTRSTEYVKPGTRISGIGTYDNPWIFIPNYNIVIRAGDHGSLEEDGQKSVTKPVDNGGNIEILVIPDDGYKYSSDTCGAEASYNAETGKLVIERVSKDIDCKVNFEPSESARILPTPTKVVKQEDGIEETFKFSEPVPKSFYRLYNRGFYKDPNYSQVLTKINPIPKRKGWTFLGYYVNDKVLVDKNGVFTKDYTVLGDNDKIEAKIVENENYVTFDPGPGRLNGPEKKTFLYDHYYNIPAPSRIGYHFRGWSIIKGLDATTAMTGSEPSKITTPITSSAQKSMGPWFKNINPINATQVTFSANWEPITYKIEYDLGTPGNHAKYAPVIKTAPKTATYDKEFTVSNPTWEGNTFLGWTITGVEGTTKSTSFMNLAYIQDTVITFKANWSDTTKPYCKLHSNKNNVYFDKIEDNTGIASSSINGISGESISAGVGTFTGVVTDAAGNSYTCSAELKNSESYDCTYDCSYDESYDCGHWVSSKCWKDVGEGCYGWCPCGGYWSSQTCYRTVSQTCPKTCYKCTTGDLVEDTYCIIQK